MDVTITLPKKVWNTIFRAVADRAMEERELDSDQVAGLEEAEALLTERLL